MSTEALNKILKEVNALTAQERRELIDRLAHEEQNSQEILRKPGTLKGTVTYMAPDFDAPSSLTTQEEMSGNGATLREWLNEARNLRAELPLTSDSVDILRELRQVRSSQ
jgi:hypothetical protein